MNPATPLLLGGFVCAALVAYGFTWAARAIAPRFGFVDKPDGGRKRHTRSTPLLGGAAILLAFGATLLAFLVIGPHQWLSSNAIRLASLTGSAALFCLLGLWDDKRPLRARDKFLLQILASLPFAIWGGQIHALHAVGLHFELGPWAFLFTVFWLVSCANVVNLIDGLDGLASSVGLIAIGTLAVMSLGRSDAAVSLIALIFAGSIAGFLVHNWPPAKIFLGDAGSLTIGYMVGAIAIVSTNKTTAGFMLVFPLALLSMPIFDTTMAILRRRLTGRGVGEADRGHIHHRLLDRGLTKLQTLLAIVGICSTMAVACLLAKTFTHDVIAVVLGVGVVAIVIGGRIFGFHELMLIFQHFSIFHATVSDAMRGLSLRRMVVHLEHAESVPLDSLWETVLDRVEKVGGLAIEMTCICADRDEAVLQLNWSSAVKRVHEVGAWELRYTIPREDGLRTSFFASGHQSSGARKNNLEQLTHIFEACGRHLPSIDELREFGTETVHSIPRRPTPEIAPLEEWEERRAA